MEKPFFRWCMMPMSPAHPSTWGNRCEILVRFHTEMFTHTSYLLCALTFFWRIIQSSGFILVWSFFPGLSSLPQSIKASFNASSSTSSTTFSSLSLKTKLLLWTSFKKESLAIRNNFPKVCSFSYPSCPYLGWIIRFVFVCQWFLQCQILAILQSLLLIFRDNETICHDCITSVPNSTYFSWSINLRRSTHWIGPRKIFLLLLVTRNSSDCNKNRIRQLNQINISNNHHVITTLKCNKQVYIYLTFYPLNWFKTLK